MKELLKQLLKIEERINYLLQIKDYSNWGNLDGFKKNCDQLKLSIYDHTEEKLTAEIRKLQRIDQFSRRTGGRESQPDGESSDRPIHSAFQPERYPGKCV